MVTALSILIGLIGCNTSKKDNVDLMQPKTSQTTQQPSNQSGSVDTIKTSNEIGVNTSSNNMKSGKVTELTDKVLFSHIINTYYDNNNLELLADIREISIKDIKYINVSHDSEKLDALVYADVKTTDPSGNSNVLIIFENKRISNFNSEDNDYIFKYGIASKLDYKLTDIDSDNKSEIIIIEKYDGMVNSKGMSIIKYTNYGFINIFSRFLEMSKEDFPYSFTNSYTFVQNKKNSKLMDIVLNINTKFDESKYDKAKWEGTILEDKPNPVKENVVFMFNGNEYLPDKQMYDYTIFFDELIIRNTD